MIILKKDIQIMSQLFKKTQIKTEIVKAKKVKTNLLFDENKIAIFENLKVKLEAQNYTVLSLNQAFENHLDVAIKKMQTELKASNPNPADSPLLVSEQN